MLESECMPISSFMPTTSIFYLVPLRPTRFTGVRLAALFCQQPPLLSKHFIRLYINTQTNSWLNSFLKSITDGLQNCTFLQLASILAIIDSKEKARYRNPEIANRRLRATLPTGLPPPEPSIKSGSPSILVTRAPSPLNGPSRTTSTPETLLSSSTSVPPASSTTPSTCRVGPVRERPLRLPRRGSFAARGREAVDASGEPERGGDSEFDHASAPASRIMTVVEQEADHNKPGLLDRFTEALYYYATMFDSLKACAMQLKKTLAEMYIQWDIFNVVCCEEPARVERHEPLSKWRTWLGQAK